MFQFADCSTTDSETISCFRKSGLYYASAVLAPKSWGPLAAVTPICGLILIIFSGS